MKKPSQAVRRTVFATPLILFCFLSIALASQRVLDSKHPPAHGSDTLITIRLIMADGRVILASQRSGEMITTGPHDGENLGIIPHVLDSGAVTLDFYRVTKILKRGAVVGGTTTGIGSMELISTLGQVAPV